MVNTIRPVKEAQGLKPGGKAPLFTATDLHDEPYALADALKNGPVVLIFYRGQWCPICNMHLKALQEKLPEIYRRGATVVAVSPEKSEFLKRTAEKTGAEFTLLFDEGYKIADAFDVTFLPGKLLRGVYNTLLQADLKNANSDDSERLPIPATFIINTDGVIVWRHFDPNYIKRSKVGDILKNLPVKSG
ncbi:MAG: AhpC/TSA family protein [Saprospiraceae bacterium]|nr:MAG: AhpC/TSA family protein [Saprospiraceae bacterium]